MRDAAAYLRVSTPQQSEAMQRDAIERAAAARGEQVTRWFSETRARDGRLRPELDTLRGLARRGEIAKVWVFKLDRLACGARYLLEVVGELDDLGVTLVSCHEPVDKRGPWRDAMLAFLGVAAEIELENIRDRMAAARKKAESQGKSWGRPREHGADDAERLVSELEKGLTLRQAAKQAGLSYSTAQRMMSSAGQGKR